MVSANAIERELDLNLLRVLVAMDQARNVSRAAELLGMSQSGFSTALARLREQFGDEVFIRSKGAMQPTLRAQRMIGPAKEVLSRISEDILGTPVFDPATSSTEFRLAMADVAEVIYMPAILRHFSTRAPAVTLVTQLPLGDELRESMAEGRIDLAVGYFPDLDSQLFFKQRLYTHTYVCIARKGHPLTGKLTASAYEKCGHAVAASPTRSTALLEKFLTKKGIERRIILRTPHHLALPSIVAESDLIATVPLAVAGHLASSSGIQMLPLPFGPPSFDIQQHWHRVAHRDPRNQWLRSQIHQLFGANSPKWSELEASLYKRKR